MRNLRGRGRSAAAQLGHPVRVGQEPAVERRSRRRPAGRTCSRRTSPSRARAGVSALANACSISARSWCTLSALVSITRSASPRRSPGASRSRAMPSRTRPSPCSGCGRREASNRRTSTSSEASRKRIRGASPACRSARAAVAQVGEERPAAHVDHRRDARLRRRASGCRDRRAWAAAPAGGCRRRTSRGPRATSPAVRPAGAGHPGDDHSSLGHGSRVGCRLTVLHRSRTSSRSCHASKSPACGRIGARRPEPPTTAAAVRGPTPGTSATSSARRCAQPLERAEVSQQRPCGSLPAPGRRRARSPSSAWTGAAGGR